MYRNYYNVVNKVIPTWAQNYHLFMQIKVGQMYSQVLGEDPRHSGQGEQGWGKGRAKLRHQGKLLCYVFSANSQKTFQRERISEL